MASFATRAPLIRDHGRRIYVTQRDLRRRREHAAQRGARRLILLPLGVALACIGARLLHVWGYF